MTPVKVNIKIQPTYFPCPTLYKKINNEKSLNNGIIKNLRKTQSYRKIPNNKNGN